MPEAPYRGLPKVLPDALLDALLDSWDRNNTILVNLLRAIKMQNLRQDIRDGLDSGPSKVFDPQEIKRSAREKKSARRAK